MMVYTVAERVEIVGLYYQNGSSYNCAAQRFNEAHAGANVHRTYVQRLLQKFTATGSVCNRKHDRQCQVTNEEMEVVILGEVEANKQQSVRALAQNVNISRTSVHRILHKHKYHPYRFQLVHELNEDDSDRRLQFCEDMSQKLIDTPDLLQNICFSDECAFFLNGAVNRHNCRLWSDSNPHEFREVHTQRPEKINIWIGIYGNHILGPFLLPPNLNGEYYLDFLRNTVEPLITTLLENDDMLDEELLHFQQDGAPPHYAAPVRAFLNEHFPGQWLGRRGPIEWPARSPDLNPLDFFLWGHLKNVCFATAPKTVEELFQRIENECKRISPEMFENVREGFESRLYHCMQANGDQFEHLLH